MKPTTLILLGIGGIIAMSLYLKQWGNPSDNKGFPF